MRPTSSTCSTNLAPARWLDTLGGRAKVFLLDDGLRPEPDVEVVRYVDFCPGGRGDGRHGTVMARVIASSDPLDTGIAPKCTLYAGRVIGHRRAWEPLLDALRWAESYDADVVSMSFACGDTDPRVAEQLARMAARGCLCFAAYNVDLPYPHSLPGVISVAAIGRPHRAAVATVGRAKRRVSEGSGRDHSGSSVATATMAGVAACAKSSDRSLNRRGFLCTLNGDPLNDKVR